MQSVKALIIGLLCLPFLSFAQPRPMGFIAQDSLLQLYYTPKITWADSIVQVIRQQATGHTSDAIYRQIKALQYKTQTANTPPTPSPTAHSATIAEEIPPKKKPRKNKEGTGKK
ncbi:hypothetical protein [Rhodoflexus sp.]